MIQHYFAQVGTSFFISDDEDNCPQDFIRMEGERPTPEHVAQPDGTWMIPPRTLADVHADRSVAYRELTDGDVIEYMRKLMCDDLVHPSELKAMQDKVRAAVIDIHSRFPKPE